MSFDHHNLERLRKLRRDLPQPLPSHNHSKKNIKSNSQLHAIETETDPKQLFKELINASTNGEIPTHLINRLKEIESLNTKKKSSLNLNKISPDQFRNSSTKLTKQTNDLYISFKQLLLEED